MTEPVRFPCATLRLEGVFRAPPTPRGAALLLHPHPPFSGSMENHVVLALEEALAPARATLRFNFRGVGESEGAFDGGKGETDDARAALDFLTGRGFGRVAVAGYSFGAWIAARLAASDPRVEGVALVSPPVGMFDFPRELPCPVLAVSGKSDPFVPTGKLKAWVEGLPGPKSLVMLDGDHIWTQGGEAPARVVAEWLSQQRS